jgi:hypothetical protein
MCLKMTTGFNAYALERRFFSETMNPLSLLVGFAALSAADGLLLAFGRLTAAEAGIVAALAVVTTVYITRAAQISR